MRYSAAWLVLVLSAPAPSQIRWLRFQGPIGEESSRLGTDGRELYFTTGSVQLWRYSFPPAAPNMGTWTRLPDAPRRIGDGGSWRGLAGQAGYLYATAASPQSQTERTLVRFNLAKEAWEIWGNPTRTGQDLLLPASGNGLLLHPTRPGVGCSAWAGGGKWAGFDWGLGTVDRAWMDTALLGSALPDSGWVSRNETAVWDGRAAAYAVKNDRVRGLSAGDALFRFAWGGTPVALGQKPWQAGLGQSLAHLPAGSGLSQTGREELWLFRGGDGNGPGAEDPGQGVSAAGTRDLGVFDLERRAWTLLQTPLHQGHGTDCVRIGDLIFLKAAGDAGGAAAVNGDFLVAVAGAHMGAYGTGCPGSGGRVPALEAPGGGPWLGNAGFRLGVREGLGGAAGLCLLGASDRSWGGAPLPLPLGPLGGGSCALLAEGLLILPAVLSGPGAGSGAAALPVPVDPALAGAALFHQWLLFDPGAPSALGLAATPGGRVELAAGPAGLQAPIKAVLLHHSVGAGVYFQGVPQAIARLSAIQGMAHQVDELGYPAGTGSGNDPYDYWNIWVRNAGPQPFNGDPTLEVLSSAAGGGYNLIIWKHCFFSSFIEADSGKPDIASRVKRLENYKLQYEALKQKMRAFPRLRFLLWTLPVCPEGTIPKEQAERARAFVDWVKGTWDEPGDNIHLWDFNMLETGGGTWFVNYSNPTGAHPGKPFNQCAAQILVDRIMAVAHGWGDRTGL